MKVAMVIQNSLRSLGGGEMVCVTTCLALQRLGYHVKLASDRFDAAQVDEAFGLGDVIRKCEQIKVPQFGRKIARFSSVPGVFFAWRSKQFFEQQYADVILVTRDPKRPDVLPDRPLFRFVYESNQLGYFWENYKPGLRFLYRRLYSEYRSRSTLLALSARLAGELRKNGYPSTELVYPSYGRGFRPRPKRNQVVYVTFLAPQKQIEDFNEIARRLPRYRFCLVGRDTLRVDKTYNGYASRILANKPSNVDYVDTRIRQAPELLEESRVYLHTSKEPGMPISVMEAISAGCMPLAPREGGGGEVLDAAGVGFLYGRIEEAVSFIKSQMESPEKFEAEYGEAMTPEEIARRASIFSPEAFQDRIRSVIERDSHL